MLIGVSSPSALQVDERVARHSLLNKIEVSHILSSGFNTGAGDACVTLGDL